MSIIVVGNNSVIDLESHSVAIQLDRVTISLDVEEFLDFYRSILDIKDFLETSPEYVVGQETDEKSGETADVILPKPDDNDYT